MEAHDAEIDDLFELSVLAIAAITTVIINEPPSGLRTVHTNHGQGERLTRDLRRSPRRLKDYTRLSQYAFETLLVKLQDRYSLRGGYEVSAAQKLVLFLHFAGHASFYTSLAEQFQHSTSTVSAVMHDVLRAVVQLHQEVVIRPAEGAEVSEKLVKRFKRFEGCVGAIDGSHIHASVVGESGA